MGKRTRMKARNFIFITTFIAHAFEVDSTKFVFKKIGATHLSAETEIQYKDHDTVIGFIRYTELPLSFYIVHSFFVYPAFRNQGNGDILFKYALSVLKARKARLLFIQPGPFDITNHKFYNLPCGKEREEKIKRLINFYRKNGFNYASWMYRKAAAVTYQLAQIEEDSRYLMVL